MNIFTLMAAASAPATGANFNLEAHEARSDRTYQASVAGTGAVTATVIVEGSNDGVNFLTLATITLSGTTSASDGFSSTANWPCVRARLTAISGTGAAVTVTMGA